MCCPNWIFTLRKKKVEGVKFGWQVTFLLERHSFTKTIAHKTINKSLENALGSVGTVISKEFWKLVKFGSTFNVSKYWKTPSCMKQIGAWKINISNVYIVAIGNYECFFFVFVLVFFPMPLANVNKLTKNICNCCCSFTTKTPCKDKMYTIHWRMFKHNITSLDVGGCIIMSTKFVFIIWLKRSSVGNSRC